MKYIKLYENNNNVDEFDEALNNITIKSQAKNITYDN